MFFKKSKESKSSSKSAWNISYSSELGLNIVLSREVLQTCKSILLEKGLPYIIAGLAMLAGFAGVRAVLWSQQEIRPTAATEEVISDQKSKTDKSLTRKQG